jgi:hypothetical protein
MPRLNTRRGALLAGLVALGLAAWAPGCLFAPDPCTDLLQCSEGGEGGAGGAGGSASPSSAITTGSGPTFCVTDAECALGPTPTCSPATLTCRNCAVEECRAPLGGPCSDDAACTTGLCAAGKCKGCTTDAECPSQACAESSCKAPTGAPCAENSDCLGGECRFGLCKANINHACAVAEDCFNGVCKQGVCQACFDDLDCPGTACGTNEELGRCLLPPGAGCWPEAQKIVSCFSGTCSGFPAKCQ